MKGNLSEFVKDLNIPEWSKVRASSLYLIRGPSTVSDVCGDRDPGEGHTHYMAYKAQGSY